MSQYEALHDYLSSLREKNEWRATFADVESILGFTLPDSARLYQAWWANNRQGSRHTRAWLDAGWRTTELDLAGERVIFIRDAQSLAMTRSSKAKPTPTSKRKTDTLLPHAWNRAQTLRCSIEMKWTPIGRVLLDHQDKLVLPRVSANAALYRFIVRHHGGETRYVGETENIQRRFGNYRNPGPTQQTSLRINSALKKFLHASAEVAVETISDAWIVWAAERKQPNFTNKAVRRLFECATIVDEGAIEIESLNK